MSPLFTFFPKKIQSPEMPVSPRQSEPPIQGEQQVHDWSLFQEGQLLIDMYEQDDALVVRSLVAGVRPEDLEISVHNDILTIRGRREDEEGLHDDQFYMKECYWGSFSRSVVLPMLIQADRVEAFFKNGVVTIILPKCEEAQGISLQSDEGEE